MNINVWLPVSHFVMQVWETQGGRGWERGREGTVLTSNCEWLCLELKDILGLAVLPIGKLTGLWGWIKQRGEGKKKALLMQAHAQLGNRSSGPERVNTDLTGYRCSTSNPTDAHPAVRPQHWSRRPHVSHTLTHSLTLVKWTIFKVSEIDWMFFSRTAAANRLIMITWSPLLLPAHDADMNMIIKPHVQGPDECCLMENTVCEWPCNKNHKCVSLLRVRTWTETSYITFMFSLVFVMAFLWLSVKLIFIPYKRKNNICTVEPPRYERPKIRVFDVTSLQMLHDFDPDTRKFTSYECSTQLHFFHRNLKILIKYNPSLRHSVALSCSLSAISVFLITFFFTFFKYIYI